MPWPLTTMIPRYVAFGSVLRDVAVDQSLIPEEGGLPRDTATQIARGITAALRYAWEYYDWPEAFVWNTFQPDGHPTALVPFIPRRYFSLQLDCVTDMWTKPPHVDPDNARPVAFTLGPDGFYLPGYAETTVSVRFRPPPPRFSAAEWEAEKTYRPGDLVFDGGETNPELAHCYRQTGNDACTGTALTDMAFWTVQPILYCLEEAVKAGANALYTRTEGQVGTAALLEGAMMHLLDQQILQVENQMGQTKSYRHA